MAEGWAEKAVFAMVQHLKFGSSGVGKQCFLKGRGLAFRRAIGSALGSPLWFVGVTSSKGLKAPGGMAAMAFVWLPLP